MDRRVVLIGGGLALIAGALLWPRTKKSAEDEVRELIAACVTAAEKRDLGGLTDAIADGFRGPGGSSKQDVKQVLLGQLFRNQNAVVVLNPSLDVKVTGASSATFSGVFVFARGRDVNWQEPGDGVSRYDIEGALEQRSGDWKIISAEWKQP